MKNGKQIPKCMTQDYVECLTCNEYHQPDDMTNIKACRRQKHKLRRPCFRCNRTYEYNSMKIHDCEKTKRKQMSMDNMKINKKKFHKYIKMNNIKSDNETRNDDIDAVTVANNGKYTTKNNNKLSESSLLILKAHFAREHDIRNNDFNPTEIRTSDLFNGLLPEQ